MPRANGSRIGPAASINASAASGIWTLREAKANLSAGNWPSQPPVPAAPSVSAENGQVYLSWSDPFTTPAITDYYVQYSSNSGETWTTFEDSVSNDTSVTVTGLTNDTAYIFRIAGVNALGRGVYGSTSAQATPTAPGVSLLLHCDGSNGSASITDSGPRGLSVAALGAAQISTAQSKFGGASVYLNGAFSGGNATAVSVADSSAFGFGTGDFTLDGWFYATSLGLTAFFSVGTFQNGVLVRRQGGSGDAVYVAGSQYNYPNGLGMNLNQWTHLAVVRASGTLKVFVNGVEKLSGFANQDLGSSRPFVVGAAAHTMQDSFYGPAEAFVGYVDEVRVVKGEATWTADFSNSLPSAPY